MLDACRKRVDATDNEQQGLATARSLDCIHSAWPNERKTTRVT
jgi:hypothetical protein